MAGERAREAGQVFERATSKDERDWRGWLGLVQASVALERADDFVRAARKLLSLEIPPELRKNVEGMLGEMEE
jgi:hypothetical protein